MSIISNVHYLYFICPVVASLHQVFVRKWQQWLKVHLWEVNILCGDTLLGLKTPPDMKLKLIPVLCRMHHDLNISLQVL